jgi:hypothetical protein
VSFVWIRENSSTLLWKNLGASILLHRFLRNKMQMIKFEERCAGLAVEIGLFKSMLKVGASFVTRKKMHGKR